MVNTQKTVYQTPLTRSRIFILEGIVTVLVGVVVLFTLPSSPMTAKFLTRTERQFIIARLQTETGSGRGRVTNEEHIRMHHVWDALKEWKIWFAVLCWWGNSITIYGCA